MKMNILIISPTADILERKKGDQIRINSITTQMMNIGHNIVCLEQEKFLDKRGKNFKIKIVGFKRCTPPFLVDLNPFFYYKLYKTLKVEDIDLIQISFPTGIIATKIITKLLGLRKPIVYDAHNVEGVKVKEYKDPNLPPYKRIVAPIYIPILERMAVKLANNILSVSQRDKESFIKKYNVDPEKITIIPSGTNILNLKSIGDISDVRKKFGIKLEEIIIVFHGTYTYYPNKEAADLIIGYIAPKIGELYRNAKFIIAGKDVPEVEENNVVCVGFIDDLHSLLNASDIAIVPLSHGGGTKLKILDYMGVGLPIVTTKKGIEGINAKNGEHAIIVDDVNEAFINAIKYLIDNKQERKRIGANARRLAEEEYDWNKIGDKLDKLYGGILDEKKHANK